MSNLSPPKKLKGATSFLYLAMMAVLYVIIIEFIIEASYALTNKSIMTNAARIAVREATRHATAMKVEEVRTVAIDVAKDAATSVVPPLQEDAIQVKLKQKNSTIISPGDEVSVQILHAYEPRFLPKMIFPEEFKKKINLKVEGTMKVN